MEGIKNLPSGLLCNSLEGLIEDVSWSLKQPDCPREEKAYYGFSKLLTFGLAYKTSQIKHTLENRRADTGRSSRVEELSEFGWQFSRPEHRILHKISERSIPFPMMEQVNLDHLTYKQISTTALLIGRHWTRLYIKSRQ